MYNIPGQVMLVLNLVIRLKLFSLVFKAASHMLVIGYGQAPPQCFVDMVVTIWTMVIGSVTFALLIAEITSIIQSMNGSASAYKEKLTQVKVNFIDKLLYFQWPIINNTYFYIVLMCVFEYLGTINSIKNIGII